MSGRIPMKRSAQLTLTFVVTLGAARAQQAGDPCNASTFNSKVCRTVVHRGGYCSGGTPIVMAYDHPYPYYYDLYQKHIAQGGVVDASPAEICPRHTAVLYRGFGATGAGRGSKAGG